MWRGFQSSLSNKPRSSEATHVDFDSVICGHEADYANATGPGHLNQAGYAAVARAIDAAVVPEPASRFLMAGGHVGVAVLGRRAK